jgi:Helix-turn-helix domain
MQAIEDHKFNTSEAAKYLRVGASTLSKLRVFGGGPVFLKLGRRVVYERADLDAWTQRHRRLSTSDPGSVDLHADLINSDRSRSGRPPNRRPIPQIGSAEFLDRRTAADR